MRDSHHILFPRAEWTIRPQGSAIRENRSLIPNIPRPIHNEIHRVTPCVPILGYHALNRVARIWRPDHDIMRSVDNLIFAIDEASEHPRSHPIETTIAQLAIEALEIQKPLLREGLKI